MGIAELQGKVAVVSGAANGIGAALCRALAERGVKLSMVDRDEEGLKRLSQSLSVEHIIVPADVRHKQDWERVRDRTLQELGGLHIVVNNAGVLQVGPALELSDERWQQVLDVDLHGVILGCRVLAPHLVAQGQGHIVNVSSAAGLSGLPYSAAYATAKFGVVGLTESLRWELAEAGVGVTLVCPGTVKTDIAKGSGGAQTERMVERFGTPPEALAERMVDAIVRDRARLLHGLEPHLWTVLRWLSPALHDRAGKFLAHARRQHDLL